MQIEKAIPADDFTNIDEAGFEREDVSQDLDIREPFDPSLIRIESKPSTINLLSSRIRNGEINLATGFQRRAGIWKDDAQSRLIESMLIRIPIPAFYVDASDDDKWLVVDGLQRLTAIRRFVVDRDLKLSGLEFLKELNGAGYDQLPRTFQRRIDETEVTVNAIEKQTPPQVKFNIFKRINTGGLPLSAQEIRHALNQGPVTDLLERLAEGSVFKRATSNGVSDERMGARECILRFFAFYMGPYDASYGSNLDEYLNDAMKVLNRTSEDNLGILEYIFIVAMNAAYEIFGAAAFRKQYEFQPRRSPINKALFEAWSVNLAKLGPKLDVVIARRTEVVWASEDLMQDPDFVDSISQSTSNPAKVDYRFRKIRELLDEIDEEGPDVTLQVGSDAFEPNLQTDTERVRAVKRDLTMRSLGEREAVQYIQKSVALHWDAQHTHRAIYTISKRYRSDQYWYGYHAAWDHFLAEGESAFCVLGLVDLDVAFALPYTLVHSLLDNLSKSDPGPDEYWHLRVVEESDGRFSLKLRGRKVRISVDEYALRF